MSTAMIRRRFGRTGLPMPVFSCGGMRYQQSWKDGDPITEESQRNLEATIHRALELGINHIETARGYGTSERQLGRILPKLPRDRIIVQTKVAPMLTGRQFRDTFETSMERLGLDHVDLLSLHGVNNDELLGHTLKHDGALDAARALQAEGRARFIGFSTHAQLDVILGAIRTGAFDYVNLHWYYFDQINAPALQAAHEQDMGVFIISPSDKGGRLYAPPAKLVELCQPLTPMAFNDLFCLADPRVHTLSVGAARPGDFDAHLAALDPLARADAVLAPIRQRLEAALRDALGAHWMDNWHRGLPRFELVPGEVNLYHALRLYNLAVGLDMVDFGRARYNLMGHGGHWMPGNRADKLDWDRLPDCLRESPVAADIPARLREAHAMLEGEEQRRLSASD